MQQHRLARLLLERRDRAGGGGGVSLRRLRLRGGLTSGGQPLLDQPHAGVVARLGVVVLAGALEERLVCLEVVGGEVRARLDAEPGAEGATGLGEAGAGQRDARRGAGSVSRRGYASETKGHAREPPFEGRPPGTSARGGKG